MEGFILTTSAIDPKKVWKTVYLKLDDISAHLVAFTDRSQADIQWKLCMTNADVATPIADDNTTSNFDETPYCFYVRDNSPGNEQWHFFSAADDATKKKWMKKLLKSASDGPQPPHFAAQVSPTANENSTGSSYAFKARVAEVRTHDTGKHAEYKLICHCEIYSRVAGRRLAKEWSVWHRFSEFDGLNEVLKSALGEKMADIPFHKHRRDALRSFFGRGLDQSFLEERRMHLDTFLSSVCDLEDVVDFFKGHSNSDLKKFVLFDENCEDVDHGSSPRKTSGSSNKSPRSPEKERNEDHDHITPGKRPIFEEMSSLSLSLDETLDDPLENTNLTSGHHQKPNLESVPSRNNTTNDQENEKESRRSRKKAKSRANKNVRVNGREAEVVRAPSPVKAAQRTTIH